MAAGLYIAPLRLCVRLLPVLTVALIADHARAQGANDAAAKAAIVAPYLDGETLAVARVDLRKLDVPAAIKTLGTIAPAGDAEFAKHLPEIERLATGLLKMLTQAGFHELYFVFSLADLRPGGPPVIVVAPLQADADVSKAPQVLRDVLRLNAMEFRNRTIVAGSPETLDRLKKLQAVPRPEVLKGFQRTGDAALQVILAPSDDTRRVLREMLPRLPDEVGGGSGKMLADGLQWAAVYVQAPPQLSVTAIVQSKDADAAAALRGLIVSALQLVGRQEELRRAVPQFDELSRLVTPRLTGDQLLLNLSDERGETQQFVKLLALPLQAARTAAGRKQSMNNLKQIGLALHNYHGTYGTFPPQAIRSKEGKPLLSWRVAILPFIEQAAPYKQFHLDEPWDSEHNRKLAETLPVVYVSPNVPDSLRSKGMTTYVAPLSRTPPAVFVNPEPAPGGKRAARKRAAMSGEAEMVFDDPAGATIARITDGTSNTVFVVEANRESGVVWTKPDDLVIDDSEPFRALRGQPDAGFNALFADGSVRFIKTTIDPQIWWRLLRMNDGQPIGEF